MIDLDKLEALAKATQRVCKKGVYELCEAHADRDAFEYACSPDVVLALVARLRAAEGLLSESAKTLDDTYQCPNLDREAEEQLRRVRAFLDGPR